MKVDQATVDQLAKLFANEIEEYRKARDSAEHKMLSEGIKLLDMSEVAEHLMKRTAAIAESEHPIDYLQLHDALMDAMLSVVNIVGGIELARQICDALEELDDKEAESQSERHNYACNFDVLATGVIDGWVC